MSPQQGDCEQLCEIVYYATSSRVGKILCKLLFTPGIRIGIRVILSSHILYVKEKCMFVMDILIV